MRNCHSCKNSLPDGAKFCPNCGTKVIEETFSCPNCQLENPLGAKFCAQCGLPFIIQNPKGSPPPTDPISTEVETLQQQFQDALGKRVQQEHDPAKLHAFQERISQSGFDKTLNIRLKQLHQEIITIQQHSIRPGLEVQQLTKRTFEGLLDFFIVKHCTDLVRHPLPEAILKYEGKTIEDIDFAQMLEDYLQFDEETVPCYNDFIIAPPEKLQSAAKHFLFADPNEKVFFICDTSLSNKLREGFAMTDQAIYWRAHLQKPKQVAYRNLVDCHREADWITVNGLFFHAGNSLDAKMLRLLGKLQALFE